MKKHLKILLYTFAFCLFTFAFITEIILGTPASPAVGNWYQQFMPGLNGRQIVDITFLDSLTGYAISSRLTVSDSSLILKTTNSGDNWFTVYSPTGYIFKKVQFINQNTGYVGGTGLLKTTNSGINWSVVNNSVTLEDMYFTGNDTGWYAYSESLTGGVFRTTNGGVNWQQQINLGSQNPDKIYMINSRTGFTSRTNSYTRMTTNSGQNWTILFNGSGQGFFDMYFADSLTGWGNFFDTRKTTNGGFNWTVQTMPSGGNIVTSPMLKLAGINKDTIWGTGSQIFTTIGIRGLLYRTTNGGNTWLFQLPDSNYNNNIYNFIEFYNKNNGWAYNSIRGIHTTTGGDPIWLTGLQQISTEVPKNYNLYQNYPNPFNPVTKIKFNITNTSTVAQTFLSVYNITGKQVSILINGQLTPGTYEIDFDASGMASGVYFYKLTVTAGKKVYTDTKKMLLLK